MAVACSARFCPPLPAAPRASPSHVSACQPSSLLKAVFPSVKWLRAADRHLVGGHVSSSGGSRILRCTCQQQPEKAVRSVAELDAFIDRLRGTDEQTLPLKVAENVLAFDRTFWLRLATRADTSHSEDEQRVYQELASQIMTIVEKVVKKTQEKMDEATDVLSDLLISVADETGNIGWPLSPQKMMDLKKAISSKQQEGLLDEGFLAGVTAQLRQAVEQQRPGLAALLQKVLQLTAATWLTRRAYSVRPDGTVDEAEKLLEAVLAADEDEWSPILQKGLTYGGGEVEGEALLEVVVKRMERTLMRTESGSYEQRVLGEFLKEVDDRARAVVEAFRATAI